MRILHFAGNYLPVPGGTTTRVRNMLASPENEHLLVVPWPNISQCPEEFDRIVPEEKKGNIQIRRVDFPEILRFSRNVPLLGNCVRAHQFVKSCPERNFDILHGHNPRACAKAILELKYKTGLPMLYEAHGIMQNQPEIGQKPCPSFIRLRSWLERKSAAYLERKVLDAADRIVVQTASIRQRLIDLYNIADKTIDVIPNGVDAERFSPERWHNEGINLRQKHGWHDCVVCLYAGYLDKINGIEFVLESISKLSSEAKKKLKIVLLGRGPLQNKVLRATEQFGGLVDYLGTINPDQMPAYYAAANVFMIPRPPYEQAETLVPMKLFEAMAMEKILLVSDVAAMAEIVMDGKNGLIFKKGDSYDFLKKLEIISSQSGQFEKLAKQARRDIFKKHTWQESRKQLQSIYENMIS